LRPLLVAIPPAEQLTFLDNLTRARRDHVKYLTLIQAATLLHQFQRPVRKLQHEGRTIEYLEATLDDIAIANRLAAEVLGRSLAPVPPRARQLLLLLDDHVADRCRALAMERCDYRFTQREIREAIGWSAYQTSTHLRKLEALEYVIAYPGQRGNQKQYELVYDGQGKDGQPFLMGLIDVSQISGYDDRFQGAGERIEGSIRGGFGPDLVRLRPSKNGASPQPIRPKGALSLETSSNKHTTAANNGSS
jgi:hypothetical protein